MKTVSGTITFDGYEIKELSFKLKPSVENNENEDTHSYSPVFNRQIEGNEMGDCQVTLSVSVGYEEEDTLPFSAFVSLTGKFTVTEIDRAREIMEVNGTAILFPYLRAVMSQLTIAANISPIILPTVNLVKMLDKNRDK